MPKRFAEFCTEKAKTAVVADYSGPKKDAPPQGGAPYSAKGNGKVKGDWSDEGSQPPYTPGKCKGKKADQIKESDFVDRTRKMSPKKFMEFMRKTNGNSALIHEAALRTSQVLKENKNAAAALVRESKRNGTFNRLMYEMMSHEEFFENLARAMGSQTMGETVCRKLARAMNEMVGPPAPQSGMNKPAMPPRDPNASSNPFGGEPDEDEEDEDDEMELGDDDDPFGDEGDGDDAGGLGKSMLGPGTDELGDEDGEGSMDNPFGGDDEEDDNPFGGDDEGDDNPFGGDDEGEDDEEGEESPFANKEGGEKGSPFGGMPKKNPLGGGEGQSPDVPKPSFMSRMMRREHVSPATSNLAKAIRQFNG